MIGLLTLWAACAAPPPDALVQELSAIHEVAALEDLRDRYPRLEAHLVTIADDDAFGPVARDRAWTLLATSPTATAAAHAARAARDPETPAASRYKVLGRLVQRHPTLAAEVVTAADCDASRLVRRAARTARTHLHAARVAVPPVSCQTGAPLPE